MLLKKIAIEIFNGVSNGRPIGIFEMPDPPRSKLPYFQIIFKSNENAFMVSELRPDPDLDIRMGGKSQIQQIIIMRRLGKKLLDSMSIADLLQTSAFSSIFTRET